MRLRLGSMFSGCGGLDLAIAEALNAETVFVADVCKVDKDGNVGHHDPHRSPCSILAHRFPGVPNLGDVSLIDWSPWRDLIEVLCAGFPCQDVSVAGGRAGLRDGTRTGLWSQVVRAVTELSPRLVVLENVPGIFTASASGDVEPCPICLGDGSGEHLRALDAVLADLAEIGFDADWTVVPASGVGAAHKRERWFCAAYPAGQPWSFEHGDGRVAADADREQLQGVGPLSRLGGDLSHAVMCDACTAPDAPDLGHERSGGAWIGRAGLADGGREPMTLLPTPAVNDMGAAYTPETWDEWTATMKAKHNNGNGHGKSLNVEAQRIKLLPTPDASPEKYRLQGDSQQSKSLPAMAIRGELGGALLPTPSVADSTGGHERRGGERGNGQTNVTLTDATIRQLARWGEYEPAIRRWEALTRPAPEPTKPNAKGNPKLSDEFDEWLMGLPAGWITDVPGVTWNEALKACGNGVVPQQAVAALAWLRGMSGIA